MLTRSPPMRSVVFVIAFFVVAFGLLLLRLAALRRRDAAGGRGYRVHVRFEQAQNLQPNADVRMAGVRSARSSPSRRPPATEAVLEIDRATSRCAPDTRVITRIKTLLGETFVALAPGRGGAADPRRRDDRRRQHRADAAARRGARSVRREDPRDGAPLSRADRRRASTDRGDDLNQALGHLGPAAEDLDTLTRRRSTTRARTCGRSSAARRDVFTALARRPESLRRLVRAGDTLLATTDRARDGLRRTVDALVPLAARADGEHDQRAGGGAAGGPTHAHAASRVAPRGRARCPARSGSGMR